MIRGLDDLKKDQKDDKKNKKTADSYTGGASSGLNVENPEDEQDFIEKMRKENRNNPDEYNKIKNKIKLTVWKNGFQIDDGEFRDLSDPKNKKFMAEVEKNHIPQELVDQGMTDLGVMLEDKKKEEYKEPIPEKKFEAFAGSGVSLGGVSSQGLDINKDLQFEVDKNKPTANINIRLHNGELISQTFNLDTTIGDIYSFVTMMAPVDGDFQLIEGFPPKPLADLNKTIEQLRLQGSLITQRLC